MEPPNRGHVGTRSFVLYREVSFIQRLKCTGIIGIGTSVFVLYREVFLFGVSFIGGSTVHALLHYCIYCICEYCMYIYRTEEKVCSYQRKMLLMMDRYYL